jgi:glutamate synthase (NADPH/NADH) large chain
MADHITVAGYEGGTGASPLTSLTHAGLPWEIGLAETQQTLVLNGLRERVVVQADGGLRTGRDVAVAAALGADEYGFATAPLIAAGCVMMRKCHLNTCPVGIATQDPVLRARFTGQSEHVINYFFFVAEEVRGILASLGLRRLEELIGRTDLLDPLDAGAHWKGEGIDLSKLLHLPETTGLRRHCAPLCRASGTAIDRELIEALDGPLPVRIKRVIANTDRAAGAMASGEIARRAGHDGLPDGSLQARLTGSAGQSFGAFLARGVTLELIGDANDYVGKGLSGGRVIVRQPDAAPREAAANIIVGNTCLYGAVEGEAFLAGIAGERFAVRNSGAIAVVEGVGDHGCEYMTGGRVVVLGAVGRNFAAGMSGGVAWVWDPDARLDALCNRASVALEPVEDPETLRNLIERHRALTGSVRAAAILADWSAALRQFVQVMPIDYRRALAALEAAA